MDKLRGKIASGIQGKQPKPVPDAISPLKFKVSKKNQALGAMPKGLEASVTNIRSSAPTPASASRQNTPARNLSQLIERLKSGEGCLRRDEHGNARFAPGNPEDSTGAAIVAALEDGLVLARKDIADYPLSGLYHEHLAGLISGKDVSHQLLASILHDYDRNYEGYVSVLRDHGLIR